MAFIPFGALVRAPRLGFSRYEVEQILAEMSKLTVCRFPGLGFETAGGCRPTVEVNRRGVFIICIVVLSVLASSEILHSSPEGDALYIIKEKLHAEVNWIGNDPCHDWEGVDCVRNHVVGLDLSLKNLHGNIPEEIGQLSFLETLNLSHNFLQGTIPNGIANLTNLHTLNLQYNQLSGGFPQVILKLQKMVYLRLDGSQLSGPLPSDIQQLSSLKHLYLGNCSFTGHIPDGMGRLSSLMTLSIWGNKLNSTLPGWLGKLSNLEILNLHDTSMYGSLPSEFGRLHKMKNLSLQGNMFTGTVPVSWSSMADLQHLSLFNNRLSGGFPTWLSRFSTRINLGCNYFMGPNPKDFPENVFIGNCFNSDLDSHARSCLGSPSCGVFYSQPENAQSGYFLRHHKKNQSRVIVGASASGVLFLVITLLSLYVLKMKNKLLVSSEVQLGRPSSSPGSGTAEQWDNANGVQIFTLEEILKATDGFSKTHEIGFGGFGRVYKGCLDNGCIVAVKRAFPSSIIGNKQFRNEIVVLSRLHHRCLVKLGGFCYEAGEQILVYEFMKNGNLNNWIWDERKNKSLNWRKRIEIAIAVAQGLDYLHSFADPPIIHRDVKPSNILLDEHLNAKLSDFGICKLTDGFVNTHISTGPAGTIGYLDPQYFLRRQLATSSDVYSFGVVLLVLITGQKAVDNNRQEECNLVEWVKLKFQEDNIELIADPHLGPYDKVHQDIRTATELALKCTAFQRSERPSMKTVILTLESLLKNKTACHERISDPCLLKLCASSFPPSSESSTTAEAFTAEETSLTGHLTITRISSTR